MGRLPVYQSTQGFGLAGEAGGKHLLELIGSIERAARSDKMFVPPLRDALGPAREGVHATPHLCWTQHRAEGAGLHAS